MNLDDLFGEEEARLRAAAAATLDSDMAKIRQNLDAALQRDIAAGVRDAEGNWLEVEDDEDLDDEEEDDFEEEDEE